MPILSFLKKSIKIIVKKLYAKCELNHAVYGKIYTPCYDMATPFTDVHPDLYNKNGEKVKLFFFRDTTSAHSPYINSHYFQWDRFNFGLDIHFYSNNCMFETMGKPLKKYGMLPESETIVPDDYRIFEKHKGLEKDFERIFTFSAKLLDTLPNARFAPFCSNPWYKCRDDGNYHKAKNISIIASDKATNELHKHRALIATQCQSLQLADTYGKFNGGRYVEDISEVFTEYRFSIVIENDTTPYYFTEKITNCFAAMTIPIYLGATEIGKFFNPDGIISFTMKDNIEDILKKCTKEYYEEHLSAVIDNFNRIKNYNMADLMFKNYLCGTEKTQRPEDFFKNE